MINLDQHPQDQNNVLAPDWHKKDAVIDQPTEPSVLTVDPAIYATPDDPIRSKPPVRPTIEPVTPADAVDPVAAPSAQNPSPETPGDLLSAPNDDNESSSSLSPVPSHEDNANLPVDTSSIPPNDQAPGSPTDLPGGDHLVAAASRQSTPLTELSGPPSPSRAKAQDSDAVETAGNESMELDGQVGSNKDGHEDDDAEGKSDAAEDATVVSVENIGGLDKSQPAGDEEVASSDVQANASYAAPGVAGDGPAQASATVPTKTAPLSAQPQPNGILSDSTPLAAAEPSTSRGASTPQKPPELPTDEKASVILQLNAELLKVCIECHSRQMMQSLEFNSYATRLQSNLTWLAAAADRQRQQQIPLPIMSPPTAVPWSSPQVINDLYHRLPSLFAKEIAKRQWEAAQANAAGVKRGPDTTDDTNGTRKRLDTGERRLSGSGSGPSSSPPHIRSPSVMSNGTVTSSSGLNLGMNMPDIHAQGVPSMGMGMIPQQQQQQPAQQQPRVSPEAVQPSNQQLPFQSAEAQMRERQRLMQLRQNQQTMVPKDAQRMPPPSTPNGLPNPMAQGGGLGAGPSNNTQVMQAILGMFGQQGLRHYQMIQQGPGHPFVNYMITHVPGFAQLPLQAQLQKMQVVQTNIQSVHVQQQQRAAAGGMNGVNPQVVGDASSPFGRHSGSPPNVGAAHLQAHQAQQMQQQQQQQQMSPSSQSANLPYASNGMGMPMQPNLQAQRPVNSTPQGMGAGAGMGSVPPGINLNNLTPQQRQLFLIQQQMHQRGNDGVINPQQAYAATQEKMRQEQQSRMSNHQQHSPPHNAGSPPNQGALAGMGAPGMPGIARSARSPTDAAPVTPRMPQKRPGQQNDTYHMALYNQAQAQRQASLGLRPGTAMGGMNPAQQQQQQQQQQQMAQYGANGGTVNPGMMYAGGAGMNAHSTPQQNWQPTTPQQQQQPQQPQQQQFHAVSPAALQHHPDAGTSRPGSSASNNAVAPSDPMGDSFDSLFNWNGT